MVPAVWADVIWACTGVCMMGVHRFVCGRWRNGCLSSIRPRVNTILDSHSVVLAAVRIQHKLFNEQTAEGFNAPQHSGTGSAEPLPHARQVGWWDVRGRRRLLFYVAVYHGHRCYLVG